MLTYSKQAIQIDKPSLNYFNTNTSFSLTIRSGNNLNWSVIRRNEKSI